MRVVFDRDAEIELKEAADYFSAISEIQRERFLHDVEKAVKVVKQFPKGSPKLGPHARRFILSRYPYAVIYLPLEDLIYVYAVAHLKRRPFYWKKRISKISSR